MTKLNDARKCTVECGQKHSATTESLNAATKASEDAAKKLGSATEKRANAERDDIRLKENLQHSIRNAKKAEESIQKEAMAYAEACGTVVRNKLQPAPTHLFRMYKHHAMPCRSVVRRLYPHWKPPLSSVRMN
jgi:hypothetical protein